MRRHQVVDDRYSCEETGLIRDSLMTSVFIVLGKVPSGKLNRCRRLVAFGVTDRKARVSNNRSHACGRFGRKDVRISWRAVVQNRGQEIVLRVDSRAHKPRSTVLLNRRG